VLEERGTKYLMSIERLPLLQRALQQTLIFSLTILMLAEWLIQKDSLTLTVTS